VGFILIFEGLVVVVVGAQPQAHRLGDPGSSEFKTSSPPLFLLASLLLQLMLLFLPYNLLLILLVHPIPHSSQLLHQLLQQPNLARNRIMFGDDTLQHMDLLDMSQARLGCSLVWRSLSMGEVDDNAVNDVVVEGYWGWACSGGSRF
jgi:hypothetical protein